MSSEEMEPVTSTPARAQVVVAVGMCVAIWWPSFTLGAWGRLFFDQVLSVWAAATAALLVVIFRRDGGRYRTRRVVALLVPSLWLVLAIAGTNDGGTLDVLTDILGSTVAVVGIPATMWVLSRIIWPELGSGLTMGRRVLVLASVLFIAVSAYLLGVNNAAFMTCEDFTVSGNSEPAGCASEPRDQDRSRGSAPAPVVPAQTVLDPIWGGPHA
ncbi:hypothetical protein [Paeniglutamicibacter kerguelensis]|nr:hypothetical protein [Paeniglutamicibacter kerguelensis]